METWYQTQLDDLQGLITKIRSDLSSLQRKCVVALVTTDVHARDIVEDLKNKGVNRVDDFNWMQQLRYYWESVGADSASELQVRVDGVDAAVRASTVPRRRWRGLPDQAQRRGHQLRLRVHGRHFQISYYALDRSVLAHPDWFYGFKLGAAPAGPAGTGKTESSKDLAKAMAIQCVVFNCSDQIDYKMMGKLVPGAGAEREWTCLDEFNRIDIEVLSVIAQQLLVLREGRLAGKNNINFMGVGADSASISFDFST